MYDRVFKGMWNKVALYRDRKEAGQKLADQMQEYKDKEDVIVLGLPRGGIPIAFEVAKKINAPLDIFVVRKLGVPGNEELAMGAIAMGGVRILNEDVVSSLRIAPETVDAVARSEETILEERLRKYREDRPMPELEGKRIILVDDGIATGASIKAAVEALKEYNPSEITIAVPVSDTGICSELNKEVDVIKCDHMTDSLRSVGSWYYDFTQVNDEEVRNILEERHYSLK